MAADPKHVSEMRKLWNNLSRRSRLGFVSHLQRGQTWDEAEFHLTGIRFVDRMMDRFLEYGNTEPSQSSIVEIGCGVGRFLRPLACRFKHVVGVDISKEMIGTAKKRCAGLPNIEYILNDGCSIPGIADGTLDYAVSAGVFQHITDIDVILSYIREAMRVLKPGGIFLFQFEGNRSDAIGSGQTGAKITAKILDDGLSGANYRIREISIDPKDKVRIVVIVLQKPADGETVAETERSFRKTPVTERRWISGVYDDIKTRTHMHQVQAGEYRTFTFLDE